MCKELTAEKIKVSIVVPLYNEEGSARKLHEEIVNMCNDPVGLTYPAEWEIIFVDDGSSDGTAEICKTLRPLRYIRFRKNYGQTAALDCGFKAAQGDFIAALDGDRQNDPADIPRMLQLLIDNDLDVISGWRRDRRDPFTKRAASRGANVLRQTLVHDGIHDSGCTLKIYRKECFRGLTLHSDQHRFIPAILKTRGYSIGETVVNHRPRTSGKSKYDYKRVFRGTRDLLDIWFRNRCEEKQIHLPDSDKTQDKVSYIVAEDLTDGEATENR